LVELVETVTMAEEREARHEASNGCGFRGDDSLGYSAPTLWLLIIDIMRVRTLV